MKTKQRIIALFTTILLVCTNFAGIAGSVIAVEMPEQNNKTNHANVTFDSYLEGNTHSKTYKVADQAKMYLKVAVKNAGYLKNGTVNISNTANYEIDTSNLKNDMIQSATEGQVKLKQIGSGSEIEIALPIKIKESNQVDKDFIEKISAVTFNGTYIDANGKEVAITKTINNQIIWEEQTSLELSSKVTKYIPFNEGENYGVLVQTTVSSKIKDHNLPVSKTEIQMQVPEMEGTLPEEVTVVANQTTNTNNDQTGTEFSKENYEYNKEAKTVSIKVENKENAEGKIANNKEGTDEYLVNFIYKGKELYDSMKEKTFEAESNIQAKVILKNTNETAVEGTNKVTYKEKEEKGLLTDLEVSATNSVNKGNIYANYEKVAQNKQANLETEYETKYAVKVNNKELNNKIEFLTGTESYKNAKEEETQVGTGSYIKEIVVPQNIFTKILGQEGSITINRADGSTIATIDEKSVTKENKEENNKETEEENKEEETQTNPDLTIENGNYVLNIAERRVQEVQIKTSSPVEEGTLSITLKRALSHNKSITLNEMKTFKTLNVTVENAMNNNVKQKVEQAINLKEVTTKAQLSIEAGKENLSTAVVNENVEIRATLDISSTENALYKNPTLKIKMPSQISKVDINKSSLLMDGGLKIKEIKQEKENESIVIKVELTGSQTDYVENADYKGAILLLDTNLTVDTLATSGSKEIKMTYTNENSVSENKEGTAEAKVNIVAPVGIVSANGISNYSKNEKNIMTISANEVEANLQTYSEKQIATVSGKIINNYGNKITNVQVLGRIPSKENTNTQTGESLGSTFDSKLNSPVKLTGIDSKNYKVYYSDKANATRELNNSENGWKEQATTGSKSYLIVTNNYEMEQGEKIDFEYNIEIPANLSYNNQASEMYQVYYENVSKVGTIAETKTSPIITTSTGEGPELKGEISQTIDTVREGQIVKMKVKVSNTGGMDATDVKVTVKKPTGASLVEYKYQEFSTSIEESETIDIGTLFKGETIEKYFYIEVEPAVESLAESININASITAKELENKIPVEYTLQNVQEGKLRIRTMVLTKNGSEEGVYLLGQELQFYIVVKNLEWDSTAQNVKVNIPMPDMFTYISGKVKEDVIDEGTSDGITYNQNNHSISVDLGALKNTKYIYINTGVAKPGNVFITTTATAEGVDTHYSNEFEVLVEQPQIELSNLITNSKYIKEGEIVTHEIEVRNVGRTDVQNVKVGINLPEEFNLEDISYTTNNGEIITYTKGELQDENKLEIELGNINVGITSYITIRSEVGTISEGNEKEVTTYVTVNVTGIDEQTSNKVTNVIEYSQEVHDRTEGNENLGGSEGSGGSTTSRNIISGTAWLDENKNGAREEEEQLLSNVQVALLNSADNSIIKDSDTGEDKVVLTDENGKYAITNVQNGSYIVVFVYDSSNYGVTTYQAKDIETGVNSDAIEMNITLNGEKRLAGITNVINVNGNNVRDIDIGLYKLQRFDLRLEKYVSKITLTTPTIGTKLYTNKDSKIEKVEILSQNVGKASMVIEYKLVVTNEGAVAGYAKKLVDYLPSSVSFSTDLNKDWYLSENGNVYNASLANTLIQPGESKEVTLVLSKKITEEDMGNVLNNNAEIYEADNEQGLNDIDSVAGNNESEEDDISKADIVISTVTGTIIKYTGLGIGIIAILVIGIYEIKKHVIKIERR